VQQLIKSVCCSKPQLPATAATAAGTLPAPATPLVATPTTPTTPMQSAVDQVKTEDTKHTPQPHAMADGELAHCVLYRLFNSIFESRDYMTV